MRTRRHTGPGIFQGAAGRRFLVELGVVALVAMIGYLATAFWISPAPLIADGEVVVPRVLEMPVDEARAMLTERGFRVRVSGDRAHPTLPRGAVVWQDPPPEMVLETGRLVQLITSAGNPVVPVPDVIGFDLAQARRIVQAAGLRVGEVDSIVSTGTDASVVLATRPSVGSGRPWGGAVELVISRAPTPPRVDFRSPAHDSLGHAILGGTTR